MKKKNFILVLLSFVIIVVFSGCSSDTRIERLSDWSFQYNEGTNDYSLFFAFNDANKNQIAAEANVDIKIVNNADEVLYEKTVKVTKENFDYFTSQSRGEHFLADIRIPKEEIKKGNSAEGTVFFKVYNDQAFEFDECNCPVLFGLPINDFSIKCESLPKEINIKDVDGSIQSKILIENMDVDVDDSTIPMVTLTISGKKTYSGSSLYADMDYFNYQLCDSEGYSIDNGSVYLDVLNSGDKFKDNSIIFYDLIPGEEYTIKFESPE